MSSTEAPTVDDLALAVFDSAVIPLAEALRASGRKNYFPLGADTGAASYFEAPSLGVMGAADFAFPGEGTPEGLLDAAAAVWAAQGETGLADLAGRLRPVAEALRTEAAENDGEVDILCYTMF